MPVRQVHYLVVGAAQHLELLGSAFGAHVAGFEVLAAQNAVDVLETFPPESKPHAGVQHLVRLRIEKGVPCRRSYDVGVDGVSTERFELETALLPVHGHQRQNEVGLVERDALGVGPDEDIRDLFFVGAGIQLDDLKAKITQVPDAIDSLLQVILLRTLDSAVPTVVKTGHEVTNGRLVAACP